MSVSPSSPTTSARPYKPTTSRATRFGNRNWTSTGGKGNGHSRSFRLSTKGQYEDAETGLYYNRFRYYDPNAGSYISQDPIGLAGGNPTLYACVKDSNNEIDVYGLNVFWSGGVDAQNTARIFAKQKGDTILEMPPHGQALEEWKSSRLFPLSYLFQKNQYKCDIVPTLPTGLRGIEPVEHAPV